MELDFSNQDKLDQQLEKIQEKDTVEIDLSRDNILEELHNAVEVLLGHVNWIPNAKITNKKEELERYLRLRDEDEEFYPSFEFKKPDWASEELISILDELETEARKIDSKTIEKYGAKALEPGDLQGLFRGVFKEFRLWIEIVENIEDRETWLEKCLEVWPMVSKDIASKSMEKLEDLENVKSGVEKTVEAGELAEMFRKELEKLGAEWKVEVRDVSGCYNIPDERTVVVARGEEEERLYSKEEAKMLTKHEIFHVVRAYNGIKAGEKAGLPPFLGMHTPFYDKTEEGGAVFREYATDSTYPEKEKDYHLRLLSAYYLSQGLDFAEIVEKLVEHGGTVERSFNLTARNREVLRHHIYLGGYLEEWENRGELWPLLLGKIDTGTAELLKKEVEANGMLEKPAIGPGKLFN